MRPREMSKTDFLNILQTDTVDTGSGTLFGVTKKRDVSKQALTLVISTGGSGKEAIHQAILTARQKLKVDYTSYVKFLVVDSASRELEPLDREGIDTLNISSNLIQDRLKPENRENFYKRFIPSDFPYQIIDDQGAGKQRLIGKVKLYDQNGMGTTNDKALRDKISGYFAGDWASTKDLPINIMILTGISGGNGSGTFMNIAAIAKAACPNPGQVTVYEYIMLPDTAAEKYGGSDADTKLFYGNGFAALKELESYESFIMEPGRKECFYSRNSAHNVELSASSSLIDYPVLISGKYDEAVSMIAETIVNTIAASGGEFDQRSFYSNQNAEKTMRLAVTSVSQGGVLKNGACPEDSHMYCGIGYARAAIPEHVVVPYVISRVAQSLYDPHANDSIAAGQGQAEVTAFCTSDRALNRADFDRQLRYLLGLNPNTPLRTDNLWVLNVWNYLTRVSQVHDSQVDITYDDIARGNVAQYYAGFAEEAKKNEAVDKMRVYVKGLCDNYKEKARTIMKKFGPRALYYLYEGKGNMTQDGLQEDYSAVSLKRQIEFVRNQLMDLKPGRRPPYLEARGFIGSALHKKEVTNWCQNAKLSTEANVRYSVAQIMKGDNGIWKTEFVDPFNDFLASVERFARVMEEVSNYYAGVGNSLAANDFRAFAQAGNEENSVNLCTDAGIYAWVQKQIQNKVANVRIGDVRSALVDDFYTNTDKWISSDKGVARRQFDDVMSAQVQVGGHAAGGNGLSLGVNDYFDHVLEGIPDDQQQTVINNAVKTIYAQLITKSAPSLKLKPGTDQVINCTILLPQSLGAGKSGQMIENAFKGNSTGQGGGSQSGVYFSSATDAIVCYQTSVANALSDLQDITLWENAYDENRKNTQHLSNPEYPTLHMDTGYSQYKELDQKDTDREKNMGGRQPLPLKEAPSPADQVKIYGTGLSWWDYPSVNYSRYADDFTNSQKTIESAYRSGIFKKRVEEALRIGIIECVKEGYTYKYYINLLPSDWTNKKVRGYKNKGKDGRFIRGKELFEYLRDQNTQSSGVYRKQICLSDTPFFGQGGFDFTEVVKDEHWKTPQVDKQAKIYMMRILRKATEMYQEMEDTMYRFYPIEWELENKEKDIIKLSRYQNFARWVINGVIATDEDQMYWTVKTTAKGNEEDIIGFGRKTRAKMDSVQRKMLSDGFHLKLVYDAFQDMRGDLELTDDDFNEIKDAVIDSLSDRDYDKMTAVSLSILKNEVAVYNEKYGNAKDPLDVIMDAYGVDDNEMDTMQEIIDFYEAVAGVIEEEE